MQCCCFCIFGRGGGGGVVFFSFFFRRTSNAIVFVIFDESSESMASFKTIIPSRVHKIFRVLYGSGPQPSFAPRTTCKTYFQTGGKEGGEGENHARSKTQ